MKYQVINEELKIASCHIADLTMKQTDSFLKLWGENASIGQLTLFYDKESGYVVLNQDNKNYEYYKDVATLFLTTDKLKLHELMENAPKGVLDTMEALSRVLDIRTATTEIERAQATKLMEFTNNAVIGEIVNRYRFNATEGIITAFSYGVMQGKRAERARRKAGAQHE